MHAVDEVPSSMNAEINVASGREASCTAFCLTYKKLRTATSNQSRQAIKESMSCSRCAIKLSSHPQNSTSVRIIRLYDQRHVPMLHSICISAYRCSRQFDCFACCPRSYPSAARNNFLSARPATNCSPGPPKKNLLDSPKGPRNASLDPSRRRNLPFVNLRTAYSTTIYIVPRGMPSLRLTKRCLACRKGPEEFAIGGSRQIRAHLLVHLMVMIGIVGY